MMLQVMPSNMVYVSFDESKFSHETFEINVSFEVETGGV